MQDKVFGEVAQMRVRDDGDLLDVLVVITHEPQVGHQCPEAVPAGKVGHVDDEACEVTVRIDLGIDGSAECNEVLLVQRRLRVYAQNP
jgi:hypothetical protein